MLKKYNIAYVPTSKINNIIQCSQYFSKIAYQYQLSQYSLPHVTICQFYAAENEIENLWNKVCDAIPNHPIYLEFKEFSWITSDNNIHWISLIPNQFEALHKIHGIVKNIVNPSIKKLYDPHMTLVNTKNAKFKDITDKLLKSYSTISDNFVLAIGKCDDIGQVTAIITQLENTD